MKFIGKHALRRMQTISVILALLGFGVSAQSGIKAGAAKVNLTPPYGTIINGDFLPMYAKAIHDSLYAKALVIDNGQQRFVFVVVDNMTIDGDLINDTKAIIRQQTGLLPEQVMISSTHSHSCGSVIETATCQADLSYRLAMPEKIVSAVVLALGNLQPAKITWGHINVPKHVSCRRWYMKPGFPMISPFGDTDKVWMNPSPGSEFLDQPVSPTDPQVSYLAVKTTDDKWISILANYSTHYVGSIPENTISADYYGEIDSQLKSKLNTGENFVGIMSNGTSGDVNTFDFKLTKNYPTAYFEKLKMIAHEISDSILVSLKEAKWSAKPVFKIASGETIVARRQPSEKLLAQVTERVMNTNYVRLGSVDKASDDIARLYALDVVKLDFYQPDFYRLPTQAIRIGDGTIGTLPGEFFSETGLKLKKEAPCKYYFTISLANAMIGYVPPAAQFLLGGYETWLCSGSLVEVNAEEKISKTLAGLIKSAQ
jgi:predicted nucleic acid-binding protein